MAGITTSLTANRGMPGTSFGGGVAGVPVYGYAPTAQPPTLPQPSTPQYVPGAPPPPAITSTSGATSSGMSGGVPFSVGPGPSPPPQDTSSALSGLVNSSPSEGVTPPAPAMPTGGGSPPVTSTTPAPASPNETSGDFSSALASLMSPTTGQQQPGAPLGYTGGQSGLRPGLGTRMPPDGPSPLAGLRKAY